MSRSLYHCLLAIMLSLPLTIYARSNAKPMPAKPVQFMANKGQVTDQHGQPRSDVDAKLDCGGGLYMYIGDGQLHYQWVRSKAKIKSKKEKAGDPLPIDRQQPTEYEAYRMDVELVGANDQAELVMGEEQPYYENYYLPQCPDGATAHSYGRLTYKNVYPNIDWVLYTKDGGVKYDFVVRQGGDAGKIKLRYKGATSLQLRDGSLVATTPMGSITEEAPYSYDAETNEPIASAYQLDGNMLSFVFATKGRAVVIDPKLNWGTYYGGTGGGGTDGGIGCSAVDTFSNIITGGLTDAIANIATIGAYQTVIAGSLDGFIIKLNAAGIPQWGTYYGGTLMDEFFNLSTDQDANIYACGFARSTGLGTGGTYMPTKPAIDTAGLVVKFTPGGIRSWASYTNEGGVYALAADNNGHVYIGGRGSVNIATPSAFQTTASANVDLRGFFAKLNANNGTRIWGSFYNGWVQDIICDTPGRLYIAGLTRDMTGVATPGAFYTPSMPLGTSWLEFVARFDGNGNRSWGTYVLAGGIWPMGPKLTCDAIGNIYLASMTSSSTTFTPLMSTPGSHMPNPTGYFNGNHCDALLMKFTEWGQREWGTYYGGSTTGDLVENVKVNEAGDVYMFGWTQSSDGYTTPDAYKSNLQGLGDFYMAIFDPWGKRKYASYVGGEGYEGSNSAYARNNSNTCEYVKNRIYITGTTTSNTQISTPGAWQENRQTSNIFVMQFAADTQVYIRQRFIDTVLCTGEGYGLKFGTIHSYLPGNVFTAQLSNASGSFASPLNIGSTAATAGGILPCTIPNVPYGTGYRLRIISTMPADTSYDNFKDIKISTRPTPIIAGSNSPVCVGQTITLTGGGATGATLFSWVGPNSFGAGSRNANVVNPTIAAAGDYIVTGSNNGCEVKDTVTVVVHPLPANVTAGSNSPICEGAVLNLTAGSSTPGVTYSWTGPGGFTSTAQNPIINPSIAANAGVYTVTAKANNCTATANTTVVINTTTYLGAYASPNDTVCAGTLVTFVTVPINGGQNPTYQWYKNNVAIPGATSVTYATTSYATNDTFYASLTATDVCSSPITLFSNKVGMLVHANTTKPTANISPAAALPGTAVTFTASVTAGGGQNPAYQWQLNGNDVGGATQKIWSTSNLAPYDKVNCMITSSDPCANPTTASSDTVVVNFSSAVEGVQTPEEGVSLYPNPNNGSFKIKSVKQHIKSIVVFNSVGQKIYEAMVSEGREMDITLNVAAGVYLLQVETEGGMERLSFTVR